ncbi:MAG: YraN family protein [Bdellovibrionaceae bacterium]|nr:YraN family protein [Bdellovibrionales bacterium]MCB9083693.1 YraN family protein [Pseudobdellovibrionaceae bacterium]
MVDRNLRGQYSEDVVENHLRKRGWSPQVRRWKTPWAEVDGVYVRRGQILLVEVKSRRSLSHLDRAISRKQKHRLLRVLENLVEVYPEKEILFHLAVVLPSGRIHWWTDFLAE